MDEHDLREFIHSILDERASVPKPSKKRKPEKRKRMETSKALILFASVMYALTWVVAVYSWFTSGTLPEELMKYATYLYGVAMAIYGGKAAFENKAKIDNAFDEISKSGSSGFP